MLTKRLEVSSEISAKPREHNWFQRRLGRIQLNVYPSEVTEKKILPGGRAVLDKTKELITTAQHHSYTQSYSIDADVAGVEVFQTFQQASKAKPNVKFGLLVDNIISVNNVHGSPLFGRNQEAWQQREDTFHALDDLNSNGHAQVVVTNDFNIWNLVRSNPLYRDHEKVATADGERAIVSSANIGQHHLDWLDGGIYLQGPIAGYIESLVANTFARARELKAVFRTRNPEEFFRRHGLPSGKDVLGSVVRNPQTRGKSVTFHEPTGEKVKLLTDSFWPWYQEATNEGFAMVAKAKPGAKVDIYTPYPGIYSLTHQMLKARKHDVEVTLHIPKNNNTPTYNPSLLRRPLRAPFEAQMKVWKNRLKKHGIHLVEFDGDKVSQGMAHLKAVRVKNPDNTGTLLIGSMNLGKGLITHWNREMGVEVEGPAVLAEFDKFAGFIGQQSTQVF